jgi:hypothetical protein
MKSKKIYSPNSPFGQNMFRLEMAQNWVRRGKAEIVNGELIFKTGFRATIQQQARRTELEREEDRRYVRGIDDQRSAGQADEPVRVTWAPKHSGHRAMPGAPKSPTLQIVQWAWPRRRS